MSEQAITTVEELPAELRAELVAKREAGTTLAELKKGYPQVAPDVIRTVLPPMPKGTEAQPAARKPRATKPAQAKPKPQPAKPTQPKANGQVKEPDKAQLRLAAQVVKLHEQDGLSWGGHRLQAQAGRGGRRQVQRGRSCAPAV